MVAHTTLLEISCRGSYTINQLIANNLFTVNTNKNNFMFRNMYTGERYRGSYISAPLVANIEDLTRVFFLLQIRRILHDPT